jgi:hypothetical protein
MKITYGWIGSPGRLTGGRASLNQNGEKAIAEQDEIEKASPPAGKLQYTTANGRIFDVDGPNIWTVDIQAEGIQLNRYCGGNLEETYPLMDHAEAIIAIVAVSQGFEPPRGLRHQDTPAR